MQSLSKRMILGHKKKTLCNRLTSCANVYCKLQNKFIALHTMSKHDKTFQKKKKKKKKPSAIFPHQRILEYFIIIFFCFLLCCATFHIEIPAYALLFERCVAKLKFFKCFKRSTSVYFQCDCFSSI